MPIDVRGLPVDLLAFPGHKALMGPMGTGAIWVREGVRVAPWREGGTGGDSTSPVQPGEMPHRLEGGTPNAVGIAGLGAGVRWLQARGVEAVRAHERALAQRLIEGLSAVRGVSLYGPRDAGSRIATVSFRVAGVPCQEVAAVLDQAFDVAVRAGLHCAPEAHGSLGTSPEGTVRASLGPFSTEADVDRLVAAAGEIATGAVL